MSVLKDVVNSAMKRRVRGVSVERSRAVSVEWMNEREEELLPSEEEPFQFSEDDEEGEGEDGTKSVESDPKTANMRASEAKRNNGGETGRGRESGETDRLSGATARENKEST